MRSRWRQNCVPVRALHVRALAPKLCHDVTWPDGHITLYVTDDSEGFSIDGSDTNSLTVLHDETNNQDDYFYAYTSQ